MARLPELKQENMTEQQRITAAEIGEPATGKLRGPFVVWIHLPELAKSIDNVSNTMKRTMTIRQKDYQLIVITIAKHYGARYMWGNHARFAIRDGVPQSVVDAINEGVAPEFDDPVSEMIYRVTMITCCRKALSAEVFEEAVAVLGRNTLTEISTIAGIYVLYAVTFVAFDVLPKPDAYPLLPNAPYAEVPPYTPSALPRLLPLVYEELTEAEQRVYKQIAGPRDGVVSGPFMARIHLPELCESIQRISDILRTNSNFTRDIFEMITLIAARGFNAAYMWGVHTVAAAKAGLPQAVIDAINRGERFEFEDERAQAIFDVCTALSRQEQLTDELYGRALDVLGLELLIEAVADLGYYASSATTINVYDIPAKEGTLPFA